MAALSPASMAALQTAVDDHDTADQSTTASAVADAAAQTADAKAAADLKTANASLHAALDAITKELQIPMPTPTP